MQVIKLEKLEGTEYAEAFKQLHTTLQEYHDKIKEIHTKEYINDDKVRSIKKNAAKKVKEFQTGIEKNSKLTDNQKLENIRNGIEDQLKT